MHISGTNGLQLHNSTLAELTSAPRLLAQQSPFVRRRLADLLFYHELIARNAIDSEYYPLQGRIEQNPVLHPGPRRQSESTYLGITFSRDRRSLELNAPVSAACKYTDLVAALWAWDRWQSNLSILTQKMRQEYQLTLDLFDEVKAP